MASDTATSSSSYTATTRSWDRQPRCFWCDQRARYSRVCGHCSGRLLTCRQCAVRPCVCGHERDQGLRTLNGSSLASSSSAAPQEDQSVNSLRNAFHSCLEASVPERYEALQACAASCHAIMQAHAPESYAAMKAANRWDQQAQEAVREHVPQLLNALRGQSPHIFTHVQANLLACDAALQVSDPGCYAAIHAAR